MGELEDQCCGFIWTRIDADIINIIVHADMADS